MGKLSVSKIKGIKEAGRYADGGGLYLCVGATGSRSWIFRYVFAGRRREMGLGPLVAVSLDDARESAYTQRRIIREGRDPIEVREAAIASAARERRKSITFRECALKFIEDKAPSWSYPRHAAIWRSSFERYVFPVLGEVPVRDVDVALVESALRPIWTVIHHTAGKVQNRIENVLDYAKVLGYREGENPARWKGSLEHLLPSDGDFAKENHHPSMSYAEIPEFFAALCGSAEPTHLALRFLILTACRTSEVLGAEWSEFDVSEASWTIPGHRMKAREPHRVPLSAPALEIFDRMRARSQNRFVFPGRVGGKHLSKMTLIMIMRRLGRKEVPHGFRSTFKDWASEVFGAEDDVSEAALAHRIKNKTKRAYLRGDFFQKRRDLMDAWANHCLSRVNLNSV